MTISLVHAGNLLASLLSLMMAGYAVSSCVATGLRTITPSNAPPDISYQMVTDTPQHRGITIGGPGFLGHEIVAAADGVVVFVNYNNVGVIMSKFIMAWIQTNKTFIPNITTCTDD